MKLNESIVKKVEKIHESANVKALDFDGVLALLEAEGAKPIPEKKLNPAIKMLQLEESMLLNETNVSANIEPFTKKLQPLLRRVIPGLLAFEIAGVQPVTSPDSSVYAIKAKYAGNETTPIANNAKLVVYSGPTVVSKGDTITTASGAQATVKYAEAGKIIVEVSNGTLVEGEKFDIGTTYTADANDNTITAIYSTETAFKQIFKDYSGPYTTAQGEALGSEMNQVKVTIEKLPVTVQTRALKAQFTMELVQDLKAMHGAAADEELMNFLEIEINLDLDREIIEKYKEIATVLPDFTVADANSSAGRWSIEMYAGLWQRILKSANGLVTKNRRGKGNILVTTAGVISALEALGKFKSVATGVQTSDSVARAYVGTLSNGMKVYQDFFSTEEYCMVIYKGEDSQMDAGVIYSPYQPLWFADAIDAQSLQPVIGVKIINVFFVPWTF